jgi:hypothetical protein
VPVLQSVEPSADGAEVNVKNIFVFGANAAMETMIRRALSPHGFRLRPTSDLSEVISTLVVHTGMGLVIAVGESWRWLETMNLLARLKVPILVVPDSNTSRRTRSMPPWAASTLPWPFFPSDLVAAIAQLQASYGLLHE